MSHQATSCWHKIFSIIPVCPRQSTQTSLKSLVKSLSGERDSLWEDAEVSKEGHVVDGKPVSLQTHNIVNEGTKQTPKLKLETSGTTDIKSL